MVYKKGGDRLTLGARVEQARKARGLTQDELAQKAGYSNRGAICRIEQGTFVPSVATLIEIAKALGVTLDWLCETEEGE